MTAMMTLSTDAARLGNPRGEAMSEATADKFFDELARGAHEHLLGSASGTLRFDVVDGEHVKHWYIVIDKGAVAVSRKNAKADAVARAAKPVVDGLVSGTVNATAALLRGVMTAQGDLALLVLFQRLFPGPSTPPSGATPAGYAKRLG
jgi:hypothetical protein